MKAATVLIRAACAGHGRGCHDSCVAVVHREAARRRGRMDLAPDRRLGGSGGRCGDRVQHRSGSDCPRRLPRRGVVSCEPPGVFQTARRLTDLRGGPDGRCLRMAVAASGLPAAPHGLQRRRRPVRPGDVGIFLSRAVRSGGHGRVSARATGVGFPGGRAAFSGASPRLVSVPSGDRPALRGVAGIDAAPDRNPAGFGARVARSSSRSCGCAHGVDRRSRPGVAVAGRARYAAAAVSDRGAAVSGAAPDVRPVDEPAGRRALAAGSGRWRSSCRSPTACIRSSECCFCGAGWRRWIDARSVSGRPRGLCWRLE